MMINKYSFQQKQALIRHLASLYQKQCVVLSYKNHKILKENSEEYQGAFHFINFIDGTLELLIKEHKEILVNDYFQQEDKGWWQQYYSKTTYYRIKTNAMNDFLHCL